MRFNLPVRRAAFAQIAQLLAADITGLEEQAAAEQAVHEVEKLRADIGIPSRLRDLNVQHDQLRPFAEKAAGIRRILRVNPRPVTVEEVEGIYETAF